MTKKPEIKVIAQEGVLILEYHGHITAPDLRSQLEKIEKIRAEIHSPFTVLVDLTDLDLMDADCTPLVSQAMDKFNSMGVSRIVRVIPNPKKDIGFGILSLFHYRRGIHFNTVPTRAEADRLAKP